MSTLIYTILILLLSAFFSGMEIAYVSSNKLRVEMDRANTSLEGKALGIFYRHPNNFITTLLVGNNISLVIYGILMAAILEEALLKPLGLAEGQPLTLALQTLLSTLVVLVFGEFLPKTVFRLNPNGMLRACALPALLFYVILYPISKATSLLSKLLLRTMGVRVKSKGQDGSFKKADLNYLIQSNIQEVQGEGEINEEVKFFQNALEFRNVKVRECIVPRTEINAVSLDASLDTLLRMFIESGNSKVIVYREDIDDIVGFVHSSEMFRLKPEDDWTATIREVSIVPESMSAQKLLKSLLGQKKSIAVVVDEFGGTSGIVTLEDLVEEIFGEIEDEHDKDSYIAKQLSPDEYLLSARLEIERVNEMFDLHLPESEEYITVSGLILHTLQSFPKHGEVVRLGKWEFKVLNNTSTKIELVSLKVNSEQSLRQ
ncbi:MAG: hemolysin family protein [Prevotellaceae bacterium]|nr:hemolysin family protein [Prevotellaceae bacterium]